MLRFLLFFASFWTILLLASPRVLAVYDPLSAANNRFGIHVLEPSEISKAVELVNSSGGDWGYVTIPVRANDRDLLKWTTFMQDARRLHVIPILRIATFPVGDHWMAPNEWDLVDFANFLDELPWPVKNRYVIVYNEPNHRSEWGGFVYPEEYARVLARAVDIFHKKNEDYFVISAGLDSSAPDSSSSMNEYDYMRIMNDTVNGIFTLVDGFSSHAYGNPAFSSFPNVYSRMSIASYRFEEQYLRRLGINGLKIFITEAGWRADLVGNPGTGNFYKRAFGEVWTDENVVAVTPFVLSAQSGPFVGFSFTSPNGEFYPFAKEILRIPKKAGAPLLNTSFHQGASQAIVSVSEEVLKKEGIIVSFWQQLLKLFRMFSR